jgi:hypothetical protein
MTRPLATAAATAALLLAAPAAHALRPDFDGERGIEAWVSPGVGTLFNNGDHLFVSASDPTFTRAPSNALAGGVNVSFGMGYRFLPFASAGVRGLVQTMSSDAIVSPGGVSYPSSAGAFTFGVYGRFYPAPLINGTAESPRVAFEGWGDRRRFDPWVSLGLEYQSVTRRNWDPMRPQYYVEWQRRSLGVPLVVGADYRVLPPLAVGLSLGITPWLGGAVTRTERRLQAGNDQTVTDDYESGVGVNASWLLALDVRYTFSW